MLGQLRLILAGLILVAFLALGIVALWYRGQAFDARAAAAKASAALETAEAVNKAQQAAIGRLRAEAERNDRLTAELAKKLADANAELLDLTESRNELEDADETVRDYLRAPVPDALRRLYDR
ncbi:hypothetical protein EET67_09965 [Pseudaminobacter arsenicus]|uniref:Uncharacterized protein n=1 Tax=Borborobacter arsenicus TaxID=1851146 RepID=A0A432V6Z2_9HYPH|nr:hypothetical protein [Pseudaminobacter arsenicus]RUM97931.1 hypothetical protein EET67_09965 [Pseudaminobacter arsenicus]